MGKVSMLRMSVRWGMILGFLFILNALVLYPTGAWRVAEISFLTNLFVFLFPLILGIREYRTLNGGNLTLSLGFGLGMLISVIGGLIGATFEMVYKRFINLEFVGEIQAFTADKFEQGGVPEMYIQESVARLKVWENSGLTFLVSVFFNVFIGLFISLLISAVLKKKTS